MNNYHSFRRIAQIPLDAFLAALELTGDDRELRLGPGLLRGPIERDDDFGGTYGVEVRLSRGPLRPPVRMKLHIDRWSPTATALELTPCQGVRPTSAYLAAGQRLMDALTGSLPVPAPVPAHVVPALQYAA